MENFIYNTRALGWVILIMVTAVTVMYLAYVIVPILILTIIGVVTFFVTRKQPTIARSAISTPTRKHAATIKW